MADSLSAFDLRPGQMIGGYMLVSQLGGGAMGTVWTVEDQIGNRFAMKILRDSLSEDAPLAPDVQRDKTAARERLRREAMALSRIRHPGVAAIVDMELDDALAFIVTELIDGENLREDVRRNGPYEGEYLELLAEKLVSAVDAVHRAGIIHRDIKPTNVMVSSTGPVLVDFGIAMGVGESHVTRTGLVMGTPGFIAPEVVEGAEPDEETDWWSLVSALAFAATGRPVFGSRPLMTVLQREEAGVADVRGLPPSLASAFVSALDPDRSRRLPVGLLLQAIQEAGRRPGGNMFPGGGAPNAGFGQPLSGQQAYSRQADGQQIRGNQQSMTDPGAMRPFDARFGVADARGNDTEKTSGVGNPRRNWSHESNAMPTTTVIAEAGGADAEETALLGELDGFGTGAASAFGPRHAVPGRHSHGEARALVRDLAHGFQAARGADPEETSAGGLEAMPEFEEPYNGSDEAGGERFAVPGSDGSSPFAGMDTGGQTMLLREPRISASNPDSRPARPRQRPRAATVADFDPYATADTSSRASGILRANTIAGNRRNAFGNLDNSAVHDNGIVRGDGSGLFDKSFDEPVGRPDARGFSRQRAGKQAAVPHGRALAWFFAIPLTVLCAGLPVWGAAVGLFVLWIAAVYGYGVLAQRKREQRHGGARGSDALMAVFLGPFHLVRATIRLIPGILVWLLCLLLSDCFAFLPIDLGQTTGHVIGLTAVRLAFLGGTPRSSSGLLTAGFGLIAWLLLSQTNLGSPQAHLGFDAAWTSLRRGVAHIRDNADDAEDEDLLDHPASARLGIALLLLLVAFLAAAVMIFATLPAIDWSPLAVF